MADRKQIDWEKVEAEFRAGQISIRAIADDAGISEGAIRKQAKAKGWVRALADKVRKAVNEKLVREDGTHAGTQNQRTRTDQEIVEEAAARGVEVVRQHRSSLSRAHRIAEKLLNELEESTDNRAEIEDEVELETENDRNPKRRAAMLKAVSLGGRASTALALSQTLRALVPLERQAFNLDAKGAPAPQEDALAELE